jgi:hypothetical protein
MTLEEIAEVNEWPRVPEDREEAEAFRDERDGKHVKIGRATSDYWMNEAIKFRTELSLLKTQLGAAS